MVKAYKIKAHILPAMRSGKSIEGDKPYFVIDSAAHYTGAAFGHNIATGKGFSTMEMREMVKRGTERSENHWDQVDNLRLLIE